MNKLMNSKKKDAASHYTHTNGRAMVHILLYNSQTWKVYTTPATCIAGVQQHLCVHMLFSKLHLSLVSEIIIILLFTKTCL